MFFMNVDRLTLPRRLQDVIFEHIFKNAFLHRYFFNINHRLTYRYGGKRVEGSIKTAYIFV